MGCSVAHTCKSMAATEASSLFVAANPYHILVRSEREDAHSQVWQKLIRCKAELLDGSGFVLSQASMAVAGYQPVLLLPSANCVASLSA